MLETFISRSNPTERKDKLDRLDHSAGVDRWLTRTASVSLILACAKGVEFFLDYIGTHDLITTEFIERNTWIYPLYESTHGVATSLNTIEMALCVLPLAIVSTQRFRAERRVYQDKILETTAEKVVYQGKKALRSGGVNLKKGDNALYVSLPRPQKDAQLTPEAVELYGRATQLALDGVKNRFEGQNYQAVVIDPQSFVASTALEHAPRISNSQLISGKDIDAAKGNSLIVSTQDLENMQFNSTDQLKAALLALCDPVLDNLFTLAQKTTSQKELDNIQAQINRHLKIALHTHALTHFAEPQIIKTDQPPFRKRIYDMVQVFTNQDGELQIQRGTMENGFQRSELYKVLDMEEDTTQDELDPRSIHYRGQLMHIIYELVRQNSLGELVEEQYTNPLQVAQKLAQLGFPINKSSDALHTIADTEKRSYLLKKIERAILPIMLAAFIYAATPAMERIIENTDLGDLPKIVRLIPDRIRELVTDYSVGRVGTSATTVELRHRSTVSGFPPPHSADWLVLSSDYGSDRSGYYTLSTSHQMEGGEWIINQDRKRELEIPPVPARENLPKDYISIYKVLELPRVNSFHFKLPLPEGTQLSYLSLRNPHRIYELTDGTIEIEIIQNLDRFDPTAYIDAYFTRVDKSGLKAVSPLPQLDESRLMPGNTARVKQVIASALTDDEGMIKAVTQKVKDSHLYSINSTNIDKFDTLTSAEELVNIVAFDTVCACDTCNAEAAWETTLGQTDDQFVNIAFGYLHMVHALERDEGHKYSSFLRGDTRHAYMLTNRGTIVDATPSVSNGDEQTEKYLEQLRNSTELGKNNDSETFFGKTQEILGKGSSESVDNTKEVLADYLTVLGITAGFGLVSGLYFGSRFMSEERRGKFVELTSKKMGRALLSPLSDVDLRLADSFFPWISFGGQTEMRVGASNLTREEVLKRVKDNLRNEALAQYSKNPSEFERKAGITGLAAIKMRYLARFL